jgi:polyhydroxyalkanoate synthesis regulator phasin
MPEAVMADAARSETIYPERSERGRSVIGSAIQQTWWLGLGLLATLGEQTARVAVALVEKGREMEPFVLKPVRRVASEVSEATEGASVRLRRIAGDLGDVRVPAALRGAARPTKEEFEKLVDEVKELRARLGDKIDEARD